LNLYRIIFIYNLNRIIINQIKLFAEMANSNSGAGVNYGVDAFLLGVGLDLELILFIRDGVGVNLP
jgi:hypothetical protein